MPTSTLRSALAIAAMSVAAAGANLLGSSDAGAQPLKNCYEQIGCPHERNFQPAELKGISCQFLRDVRNVIFKQNGYCFKTAAAKKDYGNDGCKFENEADVPLNAFEKKNIDLIRQVEKEKGC